MKKFKINFSFKGDRNYVHGTDIYNNIFNTLKQENVKESKRIDLMIHKIATTNMDGIFLESNELSLLNDFTVSCRFFLEEKLYLFGLRENGEEIQYRHDYHEEIIVNHSNISKDGNAISLNNKTGYSSIEIIVALNKALLHKIFFESKGKWYFTRLILHEQLPDPFNASFSLIFDRSLGTKLTRTIIIVNRQEVGMIYFSMI